MSAQRLSFQLSFLHTIKNQVIPSKVKFLGLKDRHSSTQNLKITADSNNQFLQSISRIFLRIL
jgi:hypothetical protein